MMTALVAASEKTYSSSILKTHRRPFLSLSLNKPDETLAVLLRGEGLMAEGSVYGPEMGWGRRN